jgi:hypothetical protein
MSSFPGSAVLFSDRPHRQQLKEFAEMKLVSVGRADVKSKVISSRLRSQLVYFAAAPGAQDVPPLAEKEYFFRLNETQNLLEEGVFHLVSPLDTANMTEVELTEEQEELLEWLAAHELEHVRVEGD